MATIQDKWEKQIYTAKDALKIRPVRQYLVKPFFLIPSINIIYGAPGSLKTNFVADLAVCIAIGKRWLTGRSDVDFDGYETLKGPVLWVDKDSGEDDLHERIGATLRAHKGNDKTPINYMSFPEPTFQAMNDDACNAIVAMAKKLKCKLIVFDNLGTTSGAKSLKEEEAIEVMQRFRNISRRTGAVIVIIHHDTKSTAGRRDSSSGHTGIGGAVNQEIHLVRKDDEVTLISTKTRNAGFEDFSAYWSYDHRKGTIDLEHSMFYGLTQYEDSIFLKIKDVVISYLSSNGKNANQSALFKAGKIKGFGRPIMKTAIEKMIKSGQVSLEIGPRNSHLISIKQAKKGKK